MLAITNRGKTLQATEEEIYAACCFSSLAALYPNITHELRGKLSNIVLHLELLRETQQPADPGLAPRQVPLAEIALEEVYAFNRTLQCLLDLMQAPQGSNRGFDIVPVLRGLGVLAEAQAKRQRISATLTLPAEPQPVSGEISEIRQALLALILFVMADIPTGGSLAIQAVNDGERLWVTLEEGPRATEQRSATFLEAAAVANDQRRLELFVAQSILSRHGGALQISAPAGGAPSVRLSLPLAR